MSERRSLIEGLSGAPAAGVAEKEKAFVFSEEETETPKPQPAPPVIRRAPLTTRIREDYAEALKRISLERQLSGTVPNTMQEILEEAIGPWLEANGGGDSSQG